MKIDVEKVIESKNPRLLKIIPKFLINLLKRLIHQRDLNDILEDAGHLAGSDFASAALRKMNIQYKVHGLEHIDKSKRYIIVSNHPLGGLDGIILIEIFGKIFKNVRFVVNDLLYHIDPLKPVFIPVNKYGRQNTDVAKMIQENYSSDSQILNFPAGLCSRLINGKIEDLEWKKSYITQALKYNRDILPVYFEGKNSGFFYKLANLRKKLGIKFNYETILLPHEMFRNKNSQFNIYISQPVNNEELSRERDIAGWNKEIRDRVYSLKP